MGSGALGCFPGRGTKVSRRGINPYLSFLLIDDVILIKEMTGN